MRPFIAVLAVAFIAGTLVTSSAAQETEQDIVNRYLQQIEVKHTKKIGWASASFLMDRINRHNDYNDFTIVENQKLTDGEFSWLQQGYAIGLDFGMIFKSRFGWTIGGEYWLQLGETLSEDTYEPISTSIPVSAAPKSEITVYGVTTGLHYFLTNPPDADTKLTKLAVRVGGTIGYYTANWDLWPEYENLNLASSTPAADNTTFKGTAPGFTVNLGIDYPLNLWDLGVGVDMSYLHLNFSNIAWYNSMDNEVIVSLNGTEDGRVDLGLSGIRGKVELKRYFSW